MTLANFFTLVRIALVPVFAWMLARGDPRALGVFAAAAATDFIDGLLARTISRRSKLGGILDPAADKLLMTASFVIGAAQGRLPLWLAVLVVARDALTALALLVFGALWRGRVDPGGWEATRVGKYASVWQVLTVVAALVWGPVGASPPALRPWIASWMVLTGLLTLAAGGQYLVRTAGEVRTALGQ